ncbi:threonine/serine exporter family protein, partial [Enterococcus faecalis]
MTFLLGIVLVQFIFSFLASAAFAIIIYVPRRSLVGCGLTGSVSWLRYWV